MSAHRKPRLLTAGLVGLLALAALLASAAAASAAPPYWRVSLRSYPDTLVRGTEPEAGPSGLEAVPQYSARIENAGGEASSGPVLIEATLPPGVSVAGTAEAEPPASCEAPSAREVLCEAAGPVQPGESIRLAVPVAVSETAPSPGTAEVKVSGGGVPEASEAVLTGIGRPGGPRLRIASHTFPTVLAPGSAPGKSGLELNAFPQYNTVITNVGAGAAGEERPDGSREPVIVTQTLPAGITVSSSNPPQVGPGFGGGSCEAPTPSEVVCEFARRIESNASRRIVVPVEVSESAPDPATGRVEATGGGAPPVATAVSTAVGAPTPAYGFLAGGQGLNGAAVDESGLDASLAGSHPYSVTFEANLTSKIPGALPVPVEDLNNLKLRLPRGLVVDPQATSKRCTEAELASEANSAYGIGGCDPATQVGTITLSTYLSGVAPLRLALYDMETPPGVAAEFGFNILGTLVHIQGGVDGSFHLVGSSSDILAKYLVFGIKLEFWGDPADPHHDRARRGSGGCGEIAEGCPVPAAKANRAPFLTMPTSCGQPLGLDGYTRSWQGTADTRSTILTGAEGNPLVSAGCNALAFEPTIESKATTNAAEAPSGLDFKIHQPQSEGLEGRANAALKDARVTLPEGMALNPAAANGLASCSEAQMGYAPQGPKVQFATTPQSCPAASKVGTVAVRTPLVDHGLAGSVFLAKPFANPFGSLLALYLAVEDEESGIVAKLAGRVDPDPVTGRLSATFAENPELPLEDIELHFFGGEQGVLSTPLACGPHATSTALTPWSAPEGADAHPSDSFQTTVGCRPPKRRRPRASPSRPAPSAPSPANTAPSR